MAQKLDGANYINKISLCHIECTFDVFTLYFGHDLISGSVMFL